MPKSSYIYVGFDNSDIDTVKFAVQYNDKSDMVAAIIVAMREDSNLRSAILTAGLAYTESKNAEILNRSDN